MKNISTLFLRATIIIMTLAVALLCYAVLPELSKEWGNEFANVSYLRFPTVIGLSITALAFWVACAQAWKLLGYIDKNKAFSTSSVIALRNISYCGAIISILYACGLPLIYRIADLADAPGVMVIGLVFTCAPAVVAVFSGVVQRLLQNVIDIKSENDLMV